MRTGHSPVQSVEGSRSSTASRSCIRVGLLPMLALAPFLTGACTTTAPPIPPSSVEISPAPPKTSVANSPTARPGELSCDDAWTTEPQGSGRTVFTASGVGFESLNADGFDPIPAQSALPWDASGYFSKSPIYLNKGVTWAEVTALQGDITFAWVPAPVWTGSSRVSGKTVEAPAARFESCESSYTGFLGGIHTPTAHACITLGVRSNLHPEVEPIQVAIGKGSCR